MDLVVHTPHGDADVTVVRHGPDATVGDLIAAVTGQAVPRVARVDDRTIDCSTPIDDAALFVGSLVTTNPMIPEPRHPDDVLLVEIAGPGAGRTRPMSLGRHRTGPGRRARSDELDSAVVVEPAFELNVTADGVTVQLPTTSPRSAEGPGTVRLAGVPVHNSMSWLDEILTVGNRAFVAERRPEVETRRLMSPDPDGTVPFSRPPRRLVPDQRRPAIDAVRDAVALRTTLWQRRPGQPGAYLFPIGIRERIDGAPEVVQLDLSTERAVAVAGDEAKRTSLARTILIETTTMHGPADLDVVIVTTADRVTVWEWAKWLPHLRLADCPMVLSTPDDIVGWVAQVDGRSTVGATTADGSHVTLLVIDDPDLWRRRDAPLRHLLSTPPSELRVVALCDDTAHAPSLCTTLLTESADGRWNVTTLIDDVEVDGVSAALVDSGIAVEVARALAPLVDTELPATNAGSGSPAPDQTLLDILGNPTSDDLRRRWNDPAIDLMSVPLGTHDGDPVDLDLTAGGAVVVGTDAGEAARTAVALAVAACTRLDPSSMWLLDLLRSPWSAALARLPHASDEVLTDEDIAAIEPDRLLARLRHVALQDRPESIVVVIGATDHNTSLVNALLVASHEFTCLQVIVATDDSERPPRGDDDVATITVGRVRGRRCAVIETTEGRCEALIDDDVVGANVVVLRPAVLGRALSPLEHRISQRSRPTPDSFVAECDDLAHRAGLASTEIRPPWLVPPALPSSVGTDTLFRERPGDAVPIGLVDVPAAGPIPMWWEPDGKVLLAFGSARSGVDDLLETILFGIVDRYGTEDLDLVVVDRSANRRRAITTIEHCRLVVAPDQHEDLLALVGALERPRTIDDVPLVVLVDDLGHLRKLAAAAGHLDRLDRALGACGSVVAVARHSEDAGSLISMPGRRLVADVGAPEDRIRLELGNTPSDESPRGRCRFLETGDIVQLATPERSITSTPPDRFGNREEARR